MQSQRGSKYRHAKEVVFVFIVLTRDILSCSRTEFLFYLEKSIVRKSDYFNFEIFQAKNEVESVRDESKKSNVEKSRI